MPSVEYFSLAVSERDKADKEADSHKRAWFAIETHGVCGECDKVVDRGVKELYVVYWVHRDLQPASEKDSIDLWNTVLFERGEDSGYQYPHLPKLIIPVARGKRDWQAWSDRKTIQAPHLKAVDFLWARYRVRQRRAFHETGREAWRGYHETNRTK